MNKELRDFGIQRLREGLDELPEGSRTLFKRIYANNGNGCSQDEALTMPIEEALEGIPDEKIDWAMQQVQRTLDKMRPNQEASADDE